MTPPSAAQLEVVAAAIASVESKGDIMVMARAAWDSVASVVLHEVASMFEQQALAGDERASFDATPVRRLAK